MPVVRVEMLSGRSREQKREAGGGVHSGDAGIAKCRPEHVHIVFTEVERQTGAAAASWATSHMTIVDGGIIGTCAAITLQDEGLSVELIDRRHPNAAASFGNCGLLAVGEVVPISKPGFRPKILKSLAGPERPLLVRPAILAGNMTRAVTRIERILTKQAV
jgi:phenylpyruvate tautomerase PptA (4-oxalocrotonate tautomerase family)